MSLILLYWADVWRRLEAYASCTFLFFSSVVSLIFFFLRIGTCSSVAHRVADVDAGVMVDVLSRADSPGVLWMDV